MREWLEGKAAAAASAVAVLAVSLLAGGCASSLALGSDGTIVAVGAENQYADVIKQVGGKYVQVSAIMSNPNTDPHTFEASAAWPRWSARPSLVVQNGLGYDTFMNTIENAVPDARKVIVVQNLLGLPDSTPNPHLWYKPATMPAVANAVADDLAAIQPATPRTSGPTRPAFTSRCSAWTSAIGDVQGGTIPGTPVATTEPVADYMLQAARRRQPDPVRPSRPTS